MPVFEVQHPDGRSFQVDAPDMETAAKSLNDYSDHPAIASQEKPSALGKLAEPITSIPATYQKMVGESVDQMGRGLDQVKTGQPWEVAKGVGNMAMGGLGYVTAPINAPIHTIVGKPLEENAGIPHEASELAASLLLPIPKGLPRGSVAGADAEKSVAPTVEQLTSAAKAGFENPEIAALELKPSALSRFSFDLKTKLSDAGLDENIAPKTWAIMRGLDKSIPDGAVITGKNLQSLRRTFGRAAGTIDPSERLAASRAIDALDGFITKMPTEAVIAGDPEKVASIWDNARGNYGAAKRSEKITEAVDNATLQAGSANSGANIDNATRQKIKSILLSPKARRGYSGEELQMMQQVVTGTFKGNAARAIGNLMGGGGGLGGFISGASGAASAAAGGAMTHGPVGAVVGGAVGAAIPAIGYAFKKFGNAVTSSEVGKLDQLIRSRSPLADQMRGPIEDWGKAGISVEGSPTPRNIARLLIASRNLSNNLKDAGMAVSPENLIRAIQGPKAAGADDEQQ